MRAKESLKESQIASGETERDRERPRETECDATPPSMSLYVVLPVVYESSSAMTAQNGSTILRRWSSIDGLALMASTIAVHFFRVDDWPQSQYLQILL